MRTIKLDVEGYRVEQAGVLLGVSGETVREWGRTGRIKIVKVGPRCLLVPKSEVQRLLAERNAPKAS